MPKKAWVFGASILLLVLLAGCGGGAAEEGKGISQSDNGKGSAAQSSEPVTLKFYMHVLFPDDDYKKLFEEPVKKKFPNVTLELIKKKGSVEGDIQELLASGTVPDITYTSSLHVGYFKNFKVPADLNELVKMHKVDLGRFEPRAVDAIRKWGDNGQLYALPDLLNYSALYYNKDIFDKFGVPYPKDEMTWNNVIDLAKKVARTDGGVNYKGIEAISLTNVASSLSPPYFDPKTHKPAFVTDKWKKSLEIVQQIMQIPNNSVFGGTKEKERFYKEKDEAMLASPSSGVISEMQAAHDGGDNFNWDMVSYPIHEEASGQSLQLDAHLLMIADSSKHKDLAFQIAAYLTDREAQLSATQNGRMSALKDKEFKQAFGANLSVLKGKHVDGMFKTVPAEFVQPTQYDNEAKSAINATIKAIQNNKVDINTALRQAEETVNKQIATEQSK
jgi:multiple sugar transport system substrate-binding protein